MVKLDIHIKLKEKIQLIKELSDNNPNMSRSELDKLYTETCKDIATELSTMVETEIKKYQKKDNSNNSNNFEFWRLYFFESFNFMKTHNKIKKIDTNIIQFFHKILDVHTDMVWLLQHKRYDSFMVLYRVFYERFITLWFLITNPNTMNAFKDHTLAFNLNKIIKEKNDNSREAKKDLIDLNDKYEIDISKQYSWSSSIIKGKKKIILLDIANQLELPPIFSKLYYVSSQYIHSQSLALPDEVIKSFLPLLDQIIPNVMLTLFFDGFYDISYGDINTYNKITQDIITLKNL